MTDSHDDESKDNKGQGSECFGELKDWDFDWEAFKDADQDIQKLFDNSVDRHLEGVAD